ncbi:helix-turn-helix domain-containing protein [Paraliobacillus salinarum]|uniref:helix-turn-helix domain-containing protein n=1 Tax=Paraliobacillus salinarum TaxID=1158996 RepID=UPI0015F670C0|nr:helix-turn-helix transcriptional regulator [Paraliobacillus salinarum]
MDKKTFKLIRQVAGLNQHEFAKKIGVSRSTVAYVEAGYIGISKEVEQKVKNRFSDIEKIRKLTIGAE